MSQLKSPLTALAVASMMGSALGVDPAGPDRSGDSAAVPAPFTLADNLTLVPWSTDASGINPSQMAWDAKGRLWIVSGNAGTSAQILLLRDTDGKEGADETVVFAEDLKAVGGVWPTIDASIPAQRAGRYNAAYVAEGSRLLLLQDKDGDGKADTTEVILTGFNGKPDAAGLYGIRSGPDGYLYFQQGADTDAVVATKFGARQLKGGGIWQFQPTTGQLEIFATGMERPSNLVWDRAGQSFNGDARSERGIYYSFPGASFADQASEGKRGFLQGIHSAHFKTEALTMVNGAHFPEAWNDSVIALIPSEHKVLRFTLTDDGSGFSAKSQEEIITTKDPAFMPMDVNQGPDGSVYLALPGTMPNRHGSIWRLKAGSQETAQKPDFESATIEQLLELLVEPNDWVRLWAKWELRSREPKQTVLALKKWTEGRSTKTPSGVRELLEAFWVAAVMTNGDTGEVGNAWGGTVRVPHTALLQHLRGTLFTSTAAPMSVRWAWNEANRYRAEKRTDGFAFMMLGNGGFFWAGINHENPRVRLETLQVLRACRIEQALPRALEALDHPMDENQHQVLSAMVRELADSWIPALEAGKSAFGGNADHLAFAYRALGRTCDPAILIRALSNGAMRPEFRLEYIQLVAGLGGAKDLAFVAEQAFSGTAFPVAQRTTMIRALTQTAVTRGLMPDHNLGQISTLMDHPNRELRAAALRLAGAWKQESTRNALMEVLRNRAISTDESEAAADGLVSLGGDESIRFFKEQIAGEEALQAKALATFSLAKLAPELTAPFVVDATWKQYGSHYHQRFFAIYLESERSADWLAKALLGKQLSLPARRIGLDMLKQSRLSALALRVALLES